MGIDVLLDLLLLRPDDLLGVLNEVGAGVEINVLLLMLPDLVGAHLLQQF